VSWGKHKNFLSKLHLKTPKRKRNLGKSLTKQKDHPNFWGPGKLRMAKKAKARNWYVLRLHVQSVLWMLNIYWYLLVRRGSAAKGRARDAGRTTQGIFELIVFSEGLIDSRNRTINCIDQHWKPFEL